MSIARREAAKSHCIVCVDDAISDGPEHCSGDASDCGCHGDPPTRAPAAQDEAL